MRRLRSCSAAGFTLIEIVLVMLIVAVLTGAVMTNLHAGYQDLALENDTKLLAEVVQAGQLYARTNRCVCRLVIEPALNSYHLLQATGAGRSFEPVKNLVGFHTLDRSVTFSDVRKLQNGAGDHEQINFHADGSADAARIVLQSSSGDRRILEIQALAGPPTVSLGQ